MTGVNSLTLTSSSIMTDKEKRKAKQKALEDAPVLFEATATSPESKKKYKVPLRATITNSDKDLDVTKTSVWVLMTLNQCTMKEVEEFEKAYKNDLTYSEKLSIKLLKDALRGNKQAQQVYWNLMEKVANRPKVLNQINLTEVNVGKGSIMTDLLDQITKNINTTQPGPVAQEGQIVE